MTALTTINATGAVGGTWQLTNLHGDVVATLANTTTATPTPLPANEEYGKALDPAPAGTTTPARYGWLGAHQRSAENISGLLLMGVRLYNPNTGRFLSVDPVPGGNANAYTYPVDPVNAYDLDGRKAWYKKAARWAGKHKMDIALTAAMFIPGVGQIAAAARLARAAQLGYRAYRARRMVSTLQYSGSAARHAGSRKVMDNAGSRLIQKGIMSGKPMRDPRGAKGAVAWHAPGYQNGRAGVYEIVVHPRSRTIYHYNFNSK